MTVREEVLKAHRETIAMLTLAQEGQWESAKARISEIGVEPVVACLVRDLLALVPLYHSYGQSGLKALALHIENQLGAP